MDSLLAIEDLEVTMQRVTIREDFDSRDLVVLENGVSIPAQFRQEAGVIADFETLMFQKQRPPCRWKRIRDITVSQLPRVGDEGIGLVDEGQRVHITIHDPVVGSQNCPCNYRWYS